MSAGSDIGNGEQAPGRGAMSPVAERLGDLVGRTARASRVFGDPVERDGITVVPVARARWGFGGGAGQDPSGAASGSGGGGGATVRPVGFIEIAGGHARFRRIVDPASVAAVLAIALSVAALVLRRRGGGCRPLGDRGAPTEAAV